MAQTDFGYLMDYELIKSQLEAHEGVRLKPYEDSVGKLTIGIGRNLEDKGLSRNEAEFLLENDIDQVVRELDKNIPWWSTLPSVQQAVLINMGFNLGVPELMSFRRMLGAIKRHDWEEAAQEMLDSEWASQVGDRASELAGQMRTGRWQRSY